jgi:pimeloyl-ACP methyl ester carboxylesterase
VARRLQLRHDRLQGRKPRGARPGASRPCLRFDYSGHGQSEGRFEDGTISLWLDEAVKVFTELSDGPTIVVGSSMGGYLAVLLLRRLARETRPRRPASPGCCSSRPPPT